MDTRDRSRVSVGWQTLRLGRRAPSLVRSGAHACRQAQRRGERRREARVDAARRCARHGRAVAVAARATDRRCAGRDLRAVRLDGRRGDRPARRDPAVAGSVLRAGGGAVPARRARRDRVARRGVALRPRPVRGDRRAAALPDSPRRQGEPLLPRDVLPLPAAARARGAGQVHRRGAQPRAPGGAHRRRHAARPAHPDSAAGTPERRYERLPLTDYPQEVERKYWYVTASDDRTRRCEEQGAP